MEHLGGRVDPRRTRSARIVTAVAMVTLSMLITPQAILRAVFSGTRTPQLTIAGVACGIILALVIGGTALIRRNTPRSSSHHIVSRYLSSMAGVAVGAAHILAYGLMVVLAVGFATYCIDAVIPGLSDTALLWIHIVLAVILALPTVAGHEVPASIRAAATGIGIVALCVVIGVGLWLELTGGIPLRTMVDARIDAYSQDLNREANLPLSEAIIGASLLAATVPLVTEKTLGETGFRRVDVRSLLKLFIPAFIGIAATLYLIAQLELPGRRMGVPLLSMAHAFLGQTGQFVIAICFALAGVSVALSAYTQLPRLLRALAADGLLPRQIAAEDSRYARRAIVGSMAVICALVAGFLTSTLAVGTMLVFVMFGVMAATFIGLAIRAKGILQESVGVTERKQAHQARFVGIGLAVGALVLMVLVLAVHAGFALAALLALAVPTAILVFMRRSQGKIGESLALAELDAGRTLPSRVHALVLLSRLDQATLQAITYARANRPSSLTGVVVDVDPDTTKHLLNDWEAAKLPVGLTVLGTPRGAARRPVIEYVRNLRRAHPRDIVTIYTPRLVSASAWWQRLIVRHSTPRLLAELKMEPGVIVAEVPFHLDDVDDADLATESITT